MLRPGGVFAAWRVSTSRWLKTWQRSEWRCVPLMRLSYNARFIRVVTSYIVSVGFARESITDKGVSHPFDLLPDFIIRVYRRVCTVSRIHCSGTIVSLWVRRPCMPLGCLYNLRFPDPLPQLPLSTNGRNPLKTMSSCSLRFQFSTTVCPVGNDCPRVQEYGGINAIYKYCDVCLFYVLFYSPRQWHRYAELAEYLFQKYHQSPTSQLRVYIDGIGWADCFKRPFII